MHDEEAKGAANALSWTERGTPRSKRFDDVYYSDEDGLAEADYVFVAGAGLAELFEKDAPVRIGELGFGTGLNFLSVWRAWSASRKRPPFEFISVEGAPLPRLDMARAHERWPDLAELSQRLLAAYPDHLAQGLWRAPSLEPGAALTISIGEAAAAIERVAPPIDVWLLDGFSPARNPEMWRAEIFSAIAARSAPGARLATYTAAGDVRRGLEAAGFAVEKRPGFRRKRHMLVARFGENAANA